MRLLDVISGRRSDPIRQSNHRVRRLTDRPIIRPEMLIGPDRDNINGPSLIRTPEWLPGRLGAYYLYFAAHSGTVIRLAYADSLSGPWRIHEAGTLRLEDAPGCQGHIASPDVHVDEHARTIRMYFHGPAVSLPGQHSFVATSQDGLRFSASPEPLASFYLRMAKWRDGWIGMAKGGVLYHSQSGLKPLSRIARSVFPMSDEQANKPGDVRHVAVDVSDDRIEVFYSRIGDAPEAILMGTLALTGKPWRWRVRQRSLVLMPEGQDEGADLPLRPSTPGPSPGRENALRDPAIFREGSARYVLYAVAGEAGIGIAELLGPSS